MNTWVYVFCRSSFAVVFTYSPVENDLQPFDKAETTRRCTRLFVQTHSQSQVNAIWMGLVRIRHGVGQHVMKSGVRTYKNRAKGSGWQANWQEPFCHSLTLKTSFFPLLIRLLFGPITSPTSKISTAVADLDSNQEVGGGAKASGCLKLEWWSSGKKASPHRFIALWKHTGVALFALWVFAW